MKKILALVLAAVMLLSLGACGAKDMEFAVKELKITLTDAFKESEFEGYDKCFDSSKVAVFVLREDKSKLGELTITLEQYANLVYSANVNRDPKQVKQEDGIWCFEYEIKNETDGAVYHYYTAMYESDAAFWIVQFAARESEWTAIKPDILKYAKSVHF